MQQKPTAGECHERCVLAVSGPVTSRERESDEEAWFSPRQRVSAPSSSLELRVLDAIGCFY